MYSIYRVDSTFSKMTFVGRSRSLRSAVRRTTGDADYMAVSDIDGTSWVLHEGRFV